MEIGQKMMFAFVGNEPSESIIKAINEKKIAGLTLFRHFNIDHPEQIRKVHVTIPGLFEAGNGVED